MRYFSNVFEIMVHMVCLLERAVRCIIVTHTHTIVGAIEHCVIVKVNS